MKRERMLQVALGLVGLVYVAMIYPLYTDLAHSKWLLEMKDACEPMFLSWFIALGPFLLLAARKPSLHRSLITFAACQSLAHASVMTIQTVEAWKHGVHRDFTDVVLFGVIGGILLALTLEKRKQSASLMDGRQLGTYNHFNFRAARHPLTIDGEDRRRCATDLMSGISAKLERLSVGARVRQSKLQRTRACLALHIAARDLAISLSV